MNKFLKWSNYCADHTVFISSWLKTLDIYQRKIPSSIILNGGNQEFFKVYKNLEINDFYSLLKHSKVLLGNSSCGILECGFIKKFVINLGIRQEGRVCEKNVYHISHSSKKILKKIKELLKKPNPKTKSKLYGSGNSSKKIVSTILNLDLKKNLIRKKFVI